MYEGTDTVKQSKLQRMTKELETIVMEEDETFDQFYAELNDIVNSVFNLGEEIPENKIIKKILNLRGLILKLMLLKKRRIWTPSR